MTSNAERLITILDRMSTVVEGQGDDLRRADADLARSREDVAATRKVLASLLREEIATSGRLPPQLRDEDDPSRVEAGRQVAGGSPREESVDREEAEEEFVAHGPGDVAADLEVDGAIVRILAAPQDIDRMTSGFAGPGADLVRPVAGLLHRRAEQRRSIGLDIDLARAARMAIVRIAGRAAHLKGNGTMPSEDVLAGPVAEWERMLDAIEASTTLDEVKAIHEEIQDMVLPRQDHRAAPGGFGM